jgi:hypothetical protein
MIDVSSLIACLVCHGKRNRCDERANIRIILSVQVAAVRLCDSAKPIQTKPIMALRDFPKRFATPILRS